MTWSLICKIFGYPYWIFLLIHKKGSIIQKLLLYSRLKIPILGLLNRYQATTSFMSLQSIIRANQISFSYGDKSIFRNFSMEVKQGEIIALKGESGAGKTTLFRLLLGFELPDSGTLYYRREPLDTARIKKMRREVAWLPQDLNLGEGTVKELIQFIFDFQANRANQPSDEDFTKILKELGLAPEILQQKFADLSTGQRQRVGLGCCYALGREVLLLDEPTSALDQGSKQKVADLLLQDGKTILSTSHDDWWLQRCDRIIELETQS